MPRLPAVALLLFLTSLAVTARLPAGEQFHRSWEVCACKGHLSTGAPYEPDAAHAGNGRQYAPDREIDLKHVLLDLRPDFEKRDLAGVVTLTFAPIATPLRQLRLDAVDLTISKVESSAAIEAWDAGKNELTITFAAPLPADAETTVTVSYSAHPQNGWFYRTAAMGYPQGDDHFWTQGEPQSHRHWFPGYDYPNERFTSEVICRVPRGMTVLSNGRLIKEEQEGDLTLFHWTQEQEHVNYLISVVGGYFEKLESRHGDLPLAFLTPPSEFAEAKNSFRDTAAILAFFEKETGVTFPWVKYYNVCVTDFAASGMENTSITTLTTNTLFSADSENLRSSHGLDAHEAAHQWFGDLLTCKDWSQLWLNEGFATYYAHLYDGEKSGPDEMLYQLHLDSRRIIANSDEKPMVWRGYSDPYEQFDYRAYAKGAWVLHMLRSQVGPELFRKTVTLYLERHRNSTVVTQDLLAVFEETTGRSWDEFFDQWVFHGGKPLLKAAYSWDQERGQAKLSIRQTQKTSDQVLLFDFPLPLRFIDDQGLVSEFTVRIHNSSEDFYFPLPAKPVIVRLDPRLSVLSSIELELPHAMLYAQLERADDMMGRLFAAKTLAGKEDAESIKRLQTALTTDPFYGVRIEAARALARTHTPAALAALLAASPQEDARARQELVAAIGKFYRPDAFNALRRITTDEKNPDIVVTALEALSASLEETSETALLAALDRTSYRHRIAVAGIAGLRTQGDQNVVAPLLDHLRKNETLFTTADFGRALDTLAYLARSQGDEPRAVTQGFIAGFLDQPKENLRRAALNALGTLEDRRSLGALRSFAESGDPDGPEAKAATESIRKITAGRPQADEVKDLRRELLELQKEIKNVRDSLETVKKQTTPTPPVEKPEK